jgi:hypothetical protein
MFWLGAAFSETARCTAAGLSVKSHDVLSRWNAMIYRHFFFSAEGSIPIIPNSSASYTSICRPSRLGDLI